jgi:ADP-ribose pyrophosphatase YjhB (NUDIX family)
MVLLYNIASGIRRIYWFIFRPKTTGVKCLIEYDNNYLLIKQTYGSRTYNWNLPGGEVEKNEGIESAVKREILEEVGIILPNVVELKKYTSNFEYKVDTVYCFYSKVSTKNFVIDKKEILEVKWFPKNCLPENISRAIKESLAALPN